METQPVDCRYPRPGWVEQDARQILERQLDTVKGLLTSRGVKSKEIAAIVNNIANRYVEQDTQKRSAEAEHTLAFLEQQLTQRRVSSSDSIGQRSMCKAWSWISEGSDQIPNRVVRGPRIHVAVDQSEAR